MIKIGVESLRRFNERVLRQCGLTEADAFIVADSLVEADLRGIHSHGLQNLPRWARSFLRGHMATQATCPVVVDAGSLCIMDGQNACGVIACNRGMGAAIERARVHGVGIVAIRNSGHFGASGYFAMQALQHDMIGYCTTNGPAVMAPWGGRENMLCNNPLAYAIPAGTEPPIVLDMACSASARGRIRLMAREKRSIPEGWALTPDGEATSDPEQALLGALLPTGGHKGYGLAVVNEVLSAVLSGGLFSFDILLGGVGQIADDEQPPFNSSHLVAAIDVSRLLPIEQFKERVDYLCRKLKASAKAKGVSRIYMPGEIEQDLRKERLTDGVPLPPSTLAMIRQFVVKEFGPDMVPDWVQ